MTRSAEAQLLLLCVTPRKNDATRARIATLLDGALDWNLLQDMADSHRLTPLLYWELNAVRPDAVPADLSARYHANLRNSMLLTRELLRVTDLLESNGIPAIPFKGPTLALKAYKSLALRSFDDLDIILRAEDAWKARDLLRRHGYIAKGELSPGREQDYLRSYDELVMYHEGGGLLELHWGFVPPHFSIALDISHCWPRREHIPLANRTIPSLHPEDLLLVLCAHGAKHCWSHLGLITDFAWLLAREPLDWLSILTRARGLGIERMVLLGASLAFRIFEVPLADPVAAAIERDPAVDILTNEIAAALFGDRHDERSIRDNASMHMRMRERLSDRLRYFFKLTFRPGLEDWQAIDLPAALSFLYPVLRFPRLALKYRSRVP
jgi:hypothetical protein